MNDPVLLQLLAKARKEKEERIKQENLRILEMEKQTKKKELDKLLAEKKELEKKDKMYQELERLRSSTKPKTEDGMTVTKPSIPKIDVPTNFTGDDTANKEPEPNTSAGLTWI